MKRSKASEAPKYGEDFKLVRISTEVHGKVKARAKEKGMKLQPFMENLLTAGLTRERLADRSTAQPATANS